LISLQYDISTPQLMYKELALKERSIELFHVSEQDVQSNGIEAPKLPMIPGTMNIHQLSPLLRNLAKYITVM